MFCLQFHLIEWVGGIEWILHFVELDRKGIETHNESSSILH